MARRNIKSHTISKESLHQIKTWLGTCCEEHSTCRDSWTLTSKERRMPTRLLEITKSAGQWRVRVIDSTEAEMDAAYVTLSHCWGSSDFIRLTAETHLSYTDNVPFGSLSQTFKDAVELTFALGFKYLWIDSLCIIQDSHDDWIQESSMMGSVYALGHLNIAATYSKNGDGGLFKQSNDASASPCIIQMTDNDGALTEAICYEDRVWHREVDATPLGNRAWVVQERVLAPRIVHFSFNQVFWECCRERAAEILPPDSVGEDGELKKVTPYPGTSEAQDPDRTWVHKNWASLVEKYSSCSLTVQSDKLVAISGLARRVCGQLGLNSEDYVAGLWKSNLLHGLLYRVDRESAASCTLHQSTYAMSRINTVFGATGNQGGSVIRSLLASSTLSKQFKIRGVTRAITKPAAVALTNLGVEVVKGDLSLPTSVAAAIKDSHTIFLVTNFWETMDVKQEIAQGKTVADEAKAAGISHLIFSSLPSVTKATDGAFKNVAHFDGKTEIEEYIRSIGVPPTFFQAGYYMSNYGQQFNKNEDGSYTLAYPVGADTKFPLLDAAADTGNFSVKLQYDAFHLSLRIGKFVTAIINNREKLLGERVLGAVDYYTPAQMVETFSEVIGKKADFVQVTEEQYTSALPSFLAAHMLESHLFIQKPGYFQGQSLAPSLALMDEEPTTFKKFPETSDLFK
ncbi:hypothetical protein IFR05_012071 [Cadophora sp. M221]|nr:hypothetical protein IFR05_012071 [Cadophora sp. M221]